VKNIPPGASRNTAEEKFPMIVASQFYGTNIPLYEGDAQFFQEIHHGRMATSKNKKRGSRSCRVVPQLRFV